MATRSHSLRLTPAEEQYVGAACEKMGRELPDGLGWSKAKFCRMAVLAYARKTLGGVSLDQFQTKTIRMAPAAKLARKGGAR